MFTEKLGCSWAKLYRFYKMEPKRENPFGTGTVIASKNVSGLILHFSHCAPVFHFAFSQTEVQICLMQTADSKESKWLQTLPPLQPVNSALLPVWGQACQWLFYPGENNVALPKHRVWGRIPSTKSQSASCKGPAPLSSQGRG